MFEPKYAISNKVLSEVSKIEKLSAKLDASAIPPEVLSHIKKQCMIALTHFSTEIEGNKLSLEQASAVIEKHKSFGLKRDEKEVSNYFNLLKELSELISKYHGRVDETLILSCHKQIQDGIVAKELCGKFRGTQNAIYDSLSGKLAYLPPEAGDVPSLVNGLCSWVDSVKLHPVVTAAIFHNQFVTIHPFIDGNGRSARVLSLYLLSAKGYEWRDIVPIDRYYADDRQLYYSELQQNYSHNYYEGRNNADFTKWIEYYVEGIADVLEGTLNQIEMFKLQTVLLNNRQQKMLKYLQENKFITVFEYAMKFNISSRMASRDLKTLVEWNKIASVGKGRATKYILK